MLNFLEQLFDTSGFPPRWHCGSWTAAHGWLHIVSDLAIWSAYFTIPCILVYFVLRRRDVPFPSIFGLFGAFILACGTTHLMEAIIFWHPVYRLAGVIKLLTATISWATVVALVPIIRKALKLRSPEELEREITARKQAEDALYRTNLELESRVQERTEALRRSETQFRQLAEAMPQIVWAARPDGFIDYCNERWYEYTGFGHGESSQVNWERILHPDDVQKFVETYLGCIKAEKPYEIEHRFKDRKTEGYRWFLGRALPVRDEQGCIIRWFGTCTDIDDAKRAQEALKETDRRKDEFLATLAHELRNPLAPIRNAVELIRRADGDTDVVLPVSEMMERQVGQMVRLVDDLLEIARITQGKVRLRKQYVELATVVRSAVESARPILEAQGHELAVSLPPGSIFLDADPTRLAQVLANLLDNAAKYTEKGGHIWLTAERQTNDAVVSVRDTGIGISPEHLPRLFEMFSQVVPVLERSQGGLGIGLSLVRRLVELHGGRVEARSDGIGMGSEFIVRLPIVDVPVVHEPQQAVASKKVVNGRKRRILVVDDNRDAADSLSMMLQMADHEVHTAYDGQDAIEAAAMFRPEVVLLDIGLPKMNGYEVARQIRQQPWGKGIALIALTGWGQEEDKGRALEAGFDHHLTKPVEAVTLEKLLAIVNPMAQC